MPDGKLASLTTPAGTTTYGYDGAGRRVSKTVNATSTYYLYEGALPIAEMNGAGQVARFCTRRAGLYAAPGEP